MICYNNNKDLISMNKVNLMSLTIFKQPIFHIILTYHSNFNSINFQVINNIIIIKLAFIQWLSTSNSLFFKTFVFIA